jgi:hypothetical protein
MKDFRDLRVWEKAHKLTLEIYTLTTQFPRHELYGLTSQTRRWAVSIGANIAEDAGSVVITNSNVSCKLLPDRQTNWIITCC